MTREDILRMAHEARFYVKNDEAYSPSNQEDHELTEHLKRFAKLIAEHERQECAKDCESINSIEDFYAERPELICAKVIRARGQA